MAQKLLQYDVMERLGEGAGSVIYKVVDPVTRRFFALKHVHREKPKDIRFIEQMETEFDISKQFNHPNLRRSFDLKVNKSMLLKVVEAFLLMELVDGRPLDVRPSGSLLETIDTFIHAAEGLRAMHQMSYVHCDIKPNNILRNDAGMVKVIDFGQSCKIGTVKERIQGTPDYISPEQVKGKRGDHRSDIYSLGAMLYEMVTGSTPFEGESPYVVMNARVTGDPVAPRKLDPEIHPALEEVILHALERDPRARFQDAAQMKHELEHLDDVKLTDRALHLRSPQPWRARLSPGWIILAVIVLLMLSTLIDVWLVHRHH
jgi:serine/threonine-protein kinase